MGFVTELIDISHFRVCLRNAATGKTVTVTTTPAVQVQVGSIRVMLKINVTVKLEATQLTPIM